MTGFLRSTGSILLTSILFTSTMALADASEYPTGNKNLKSIQKMMQEKKSHMDQIFGLIVTENLKKIPEEANTLKMISEVNSWHMNEDADFMRYNQNFQEAVKALAQRGKEGNLDASLLAYMQVGMVCVQCHKHVRDQAVKRK